MAEECYDELLDPGERPELTQWLTDLRQGVGDNLQLIIWDDTDFGIVWELFWHDMDGMPAWLGTTAEIIRWVTVRTPERRRQFSAEKDTAVGSQILYFEDPALLPTRNYSILDPLKKSAYVDGKSMKGLLNELDDEGERWSVRPRCTSGATAGTAISVTRPCWPTCHCLRFPVFNLMRFVNPRRWSS